jgi:PIN domain nuclease of toxin-antitoxin system
VILLDTHAAIWVASDDPALGKRSRAAARMALGQDQLAVSAISFWELALLIAKGRLKSFDSAAEMRAQILHGGIVELPLTGDIALRAVDLGNLPGDPADRFIAATAICHGATLITADDHLLTWRHSLKRMDARK